jgi:SagB-type dehydrogenase family enzyme
VNASVATSSASPDVDDTPVGLRGDVILQREGRVVRLLSPVGSLALRGVADVVGDLLDRMKSHPVQLRRAAAQLPPTEAGQLARIAVSAGPLFERFLVADGRTLVTVEVTARDAVDRVIEVSLDAPVRLTKFTLLRSHGGELVVESPTAKHRVRLADAAARNLVAALGRPRRGRDLVGPLSAAAVGALLGLLAGVGLVEVAATSVPGSGPGSQPEFPSDTDSVLRQWDFHDLLVHARARSGRFDQPFGGIFPYRGELPPQPAVKEPPAGPGLALPRPVLEEVLSRDPALTSVLEARTSVRQYASEPMTVAQLGEFLYRTSRVRARYGPSEATPYEATTRPYPCGGAAYELELYVTVQRCAGVAPGAYYYDPVGHQLFLVNADPADRRAMLHVASVATGLQADPDVLITITSRFQRLSWKYRAIAYSVTLKHVGVLYQTMYLVATAMALAPCGLGSGDADLAARVLGLEYLQESSVGDFLLGSRPLVASDAPPRPLPPAWQPVNDPGWGTAAQAELGRRRRAAR